MKREQNQALILGLIFVLLGAFGFFKNFLGITFKCGLICMDLDTKLVTHAVWGVICSIIAYSKNRRPVPAFFSGLIFASLGVLYYLLSKAGMTEKEKELHDWEIQKKYEQMQKEKTKP